jgi:hypothetical protein
MEEAGIDRRRVAGETGQNLTELRKRYTFLSAHECKILPFVGVQSIPC